MNLIEIIEWLAKTLLQTNLPWPEFRFCNRDVDIAVYPFITGVDLDTMETSEPYPLSLTNDPDWVAVRRLVIRVGNISETGAEVSWETGETLACVETWQLKVCPLSNITGNNEVSS